MILQDNHNGTIATGTSTYPSSCNAIVIVVNIGLSGDKQWRYTARDSDRVGWISNRIHHDIHEGKALFGNEVHLIASDSNIVHPLRTIEEELLRSSWMKQKNEPLMLTAMISPVSVAHMTEGPVLFPCQCGRCQFLITGPDLCLNQFCYGPVFRIGKLHCPKFC